MKTNSQLYRRILWKAVVIILMTAFPLNISSQTDSEAIRYTNQAWMFGAGHTNLYDTYLSPIEYKGTSMRIYNERMRGTKWFNNKFKKQQFIGLEFAMTDNLVKNASRYKLMLDYRLGGHYEFYNKSNLKIGGGALWNFNGGVEFNERNGNNPASAKIYTNIDASIIISYAFPKFVVRWQIDSPFMGMLFSPRFGQSYYEISLGNSVGVVNFASLHNQRAIRNYVTIDIPINKYTVRVGYLGSHYQSRVHGIQTHAYTHSFVLGFPIEGVMKEKKKAKNLYWNN